MKLPPRLRLCGRRSGVMSLELVLVLPIVLIVLFGVVEFGLLFGARQSLVTASRAGARVASLCGAGQADVEAVVHEQLDPALCANLTVDVELGRCPGDPVRVRLRVPMRSASPDLLSCIGLGLGDSSLVAETVMSKE